MKTPIKIINEFNIHEGNKIFNYRSISLYERNSKIVGIRIVKNRYIK